MNNTESVGQQQALQLIFMLAWSSEGSAWERLLATFITGSVTLRVVTDAVTFLAIVKQKAMRYSKEHMIMAFMSLFDWLDANWMWCTVALDYGLQSRVGCFFKLRHALWFVTGGQSSTAILAMVSVDRLVAASKPTWYWKVGVSWTYKLVGVVVAWQVLFDVYLLYKVLQQPEEMVPYCFTSHVFGNGFDLNNDLRKLFLLASIVIYIAALVQYKRYLIAELMKVNARPSNQRNRWNAYKKRLSKMTKTLGISACITMFFYVVPLYAWGVLRKTFPSYQQYGWICFALIALSSVANLFLFTYRHKEVKKAVHALIHCKQLPANMDNWF